jgi:hypothetical protein
MISLIWKTDRKYKAQKNKQWPVQHYTAQKTTWPSLKRLGELRCPGRVTRSCSTFWYRNLVIICVFKGTWLSSLSYPDFILKPAFILLTSYTEQYFSNGQNKMLVFGFVPNATRLVPKSGTRTSYPSGAPEFTKTF